MRKARQLLNCPIILLATPVILPREEFYAPGAVLVVAGATGVIGIEQNGSSPALLVDDWLASLD